MRLRPAGQQDLGAIIELCAAAGLEAWTVQSYAELMMRPEVDFQLALREMGEQPIGFVLARKVAEEQELLQIAVRPSEQGRGVGRKLLRWCLSRAASQGCVTCYLEVRRSNQKAVEFYMRYGFSIRGVRKGYYQAPVEDALVMSRPLARPPEAIQKGEQ